MAKKNFDKLRSKWRNKKIDDYKPHDIVTYFGYRYFKRFHIPAPNPPGKCHAQIKMLMNNYDKEQICKAIRWLMRPENQKKLGRNVMPSIAVLVGFRATIFPFALGKANHHEVEDSRSTKKVKGKFGKKSRVGW